MSQVEMARALSVKPDAYKKYEGRSYLPYHLMGQFCRITGAMCDELILGMEWDEGGTRLSLRLVGRTPTK
jgi:hypothetical protein